MFYFAAALIALLAAEIMMATGFGFSGCGACRAPDPRSSVAIGWLSLLMCGALLQFLPVLVAQPLYSNALALPALVSLVAGLAALILGFLQLGGRLDPDIPYFATGAIPQGVRQPHLLLSSRH